MSQVNYSVSTTLLMRVDSTMKLKKCYDNKTIQFGCAANWLDYAMKYNNQSVGDYYECIFAHLPKGDPRINCVKDVKGKPMGDHLLIMESQLDGSVLLRFIPTILIPVICFFSFNVPKIKEEMDKDGEPTKWFAFNLDEYREAMNYQEKDSCFLLITNPEEFINDLMQAIPFAVKKNKEKLTSKRFYNNFNPNEPLILKDVDYHKYSDKTPFFDCSGDCKELFWKHPKYEEQSELRMGIPNLNFIQTYVPNSYDYTKNTLDVFLPHFHEYAKLFSASVAHSLFFGKIDSTNQTNDFAVLKMTIKEIQENIKANNGKFVMNKQV